MKSKYAAKGVTEHKNYEQPAKRIVNICLTNIELDVIKEKQAAVRWIGLTYTLLLFF